MERICSEKSEPALDFVSANFRNRSNFSSIFRERSAAKFSCTFLSASSASPSFFSARESCNSRILSPSCSESSAANSSRMERICSAISGVSFDFDSTSFRTCSNFLSIFREKSAANLFCSLKSSSLTLSSFFSGAFMRKRMSSTSSSLTYMLALMSLSSNPIPPKAVSPLRLLNNFSRKAAACAEISNTEMSVFAKKFPSIDSPKFFIIGRMRSRSLSTVMSSSSVK